MELIINLRIKIDMNELKFSYARSSGPGGQHVNKTSTKVLLKWDISASSSITNRTKSVLLKKLSNKITNESIITVSSDRFRSQDRNKEDCLEKLKLIIINATKVKKKRIATKPTKASKEKRLKEKKSRSEIKKMRQKKY